MSRLLYALLVTAIACFSASAQQSAPPQVQALSDRLLAELSANVACHTDLIALRAKLAAAEAELEALKKAAAPPPPK